MNQFDFVALPRQAEFARRLLLFLALAILVTGCQSTSLMRMRNKTRRQPGNELSVDSIAPTKSGNLPYASQPNNHAERKVLRLQSPSTSSELSETYFDDENLGQSLAYTTPEIVDDLSLFVPGEVTAQDSGKLIGVQAGQGYWSQRWQAVKQDYLNFYSGDGITRLLLGFAAGGAMAHSNFDTFVTDDLFRENILGASIDEWAEALHEPKLIGDGYVTIPLFVGLSLAEPLWDDYPWGQTASTWGSRSARTILLGGPALLVSQTLVGGSRPHESSSGSHWTPFRDNNGVSGHSFMGAVPFLTAAKMTENRWAKALLYTGSVLPAISRINDERHYASQAFLGWYLAYVAAEMVHRTDRPHSRGTWSPWFTTEGAGLMWEKKF